VKRKSSAEKSVRGHRPGNKKGLRSLKGDALEEKKTPGEKKKIFRCPNRGEGKLRRMRSARCPPIGLREGEKGIYPTTFVFCKKREAGRRKKTGDNQARKQPVIFLERRKAAFSGPQWKKGGAASAAGDLGGSRKKTKKKKKIYALPAPRLKKKSGRPTYPRRKGNGARNRIE